MKLCEVIDRHRLVVCIGSGGTGKTTVAASIALGAAVAGRRAMVLTIDPAKQLARAMGMEGLSAEGQPVEDQALRAVGLSPRGTLSAGMLDEKTAWDAFVRRHAPSSQAESAILSNPFYQQLSTSFAGTTEYMAVEELCRLQDLGRYDLIVLDTPPAAHAFDFVRAPQRIDRLLDPETARWLSPAALSVAGASGRAARAVLRRLERASGTEALRNVSSFFGALWGLFGSIRSRAEHARRMLADPATGFVLVASPRDDLVAEAETLATHLQRLGSSLAAVVLNRVLPLEVGPDVDERALEALVGTWQSAGASMDAAAHLVRAQRLMRAKRRAEHRLAADLIRVLPAGAPLVTVPLRSSDAHTMIDIAAIAEQLWAS